MAALANPFVAVARPSEAPAREPRHALASLAALHAEAVETARLANLLGRSLHVAIALPVFAGLTIVLGGNGVAPAAAWAAMVGIAAAVMLRRYALVAGMPFERATLKAFAADLDAALLYAGFAWGAGAFLSLPAGASGTAALAFAILPGLAVAAMLRENRPALFFLAPVAGLASLACAMRPLGDGLLAAALVLSACGVLGGALYLLSRRSGGLALPKLSIDAQ